MWCECGNTRHIAQVCVCTAQYRVVRYTFCGIDNACTLQSAMPPNCTDSRTVMLRPLTWRHMLICTTIVGLITTLVHATIVVHATITHITHAIYALKCELVFNSPLACFARTLQVIAVVKVSHMSAFSIVIVTTCFGYSLRVSKTITQFAQ